MVLSSYSMCFKFWVSVVDKSETSGVGGGGGDADGEADISILLLMARTCDAGELESDRSSSRVLV